MNRPLASLTSLALFVGVFSAVVPARADDKEACIAASEGAQKLRGERRFAAAREQFLLCARETCPSVIRKDCTEGLIDLDKRTPTVSLRARDARGGDLADVAVFVDGVLVVSALDGKAIPLDPGVHALKFASSGHVPVEQRIVVSEGERDRPVVVTLVSASSPIEAAPDPAVSAPAPAVPSTKRPLAVGAYVVTGVGLAAVGVGAVLYVVGLKQRSADLGGACGSAAQCDSERSSISAKLVAGDVLTGVGAAAVATGVVWAFVHYASSPKEGARAATSVTALPLAGGGFGSVSLAF